MKVERFQQPIPAIYSRKQIRIEKVKNSATSDDAVTFDTDDRRKRQEHQTPTDDDQPEPEHSPATTRHVSTSPEAPAPGPSIDLMV